MAWLPNGGVFLLFLYFTASPPAKGIIESEHVNGSAAAARRAPVEAKGVEKEEEAKACLGYVAACEREITGVRRLEGRVSEHAANSL